MRVIQDEITEMMLAATPNATAVATGSGAVAATTRKQSEPEMDSSSLSSSSSTVSSSSTSSSGSERSSNSSLAALAEKEPSLRPSILKQLLQNLSFAQSGLDGDMFSVVVWEEDTEDEEEEEERQDSTTTVSPPSPPPVPVPVSSSSTNNHQHQHQQKTTPVKKSQPRRSPGYSRRTPSPHFLSRKQMSPDGVVTIPTLTSGERKPLPPPSRHVRFNTPSNVVVFVPTRAEFDPSTKRAMWTDAKELQDQIFRNKMEYQAEGGDPTQVLEDDDMYRDVLTGELIHPYWIEQATAPEDITPIAIDDIDAW
eukprot:CAMPEP_0113454826 /NCGR_PEP_ID=MMETSP0014_2-20120614/8063_1 /TAXON_ID=2857 /ORGANISM="Nitzschia sp." /LENGTH=308 /DNA_ID=CAMNT_0000346243 /DNA_START=21 /DNA_END=947 /DNA_ORIENTATION=- /assembly_acc=CAM_ASM_000159